MLNDVGLPDFSWESTSGQLTRAVFLSETCLPRFPPCDVRIAMEGFVEEYNRCWILEKLGYQSPLEAKATWAKEEVA